MTATKPPDGHDADPMPAEPRNPVGALLRRWIDEVGANNAIVARILDVSEPTVHGYITKTRLEVSPAMRTKMIRMMRLPKPVMEAAAAAAAGYDVDDLPADVELIARMLAELPAGDREEIAELVDSRLRALRRRARRGKPLGEGPV